MSGPARPSEPAPPDARAAVAAEDGAGAQTAAEWIARLGRELGVEGMTPATQAALLSIARDVAHGAERKYAPLASFVAGRYVEASARQGRDAASALDEVSQAVDRLLSGGQPPTP